MSCIVFFTKETLKNICILAVEYFSILNFFILICFEVAENFGIAILVVVSRVPFDSEPLQQTIMVSYGNYPNMPVV